MPVTISQATLDEIARVARARNPAPRTTTAVIATAICDGRDYECHAEPRTCHESAASHREQTGHRVLVIETTTTTYEATR